jgi:hypothetical protein
MLTRWSGAAPSKSASGALNDSTPLSRFISHAESVASPPPAAALPTDDGGMPDVTPTPTPKPQPLTSRNTNSLLNFYSNPRPLPLGLFLSQRVLQVAAVRQRIKAPPHPTANPPTQKPKLLIPNHSPLIISQDRIAAKMRQKLPQSYSPVDVIAAAPTEPQVCEEK